MEKFKTKPNIAGNRNLGFVFLSHFTVKLFYGCLFCRREKENPFENKKETKEPPKTKLIQPASTQISSVCPTKIDPVAIALHDYQPTSTEDLEFQVTEIIFRKENLCI